MAYGGLLGPASILVFYAIWLPRLRYNGVLCHILCRTSRITLLFILWACVSVSWSPYVATSLYSVLEYSSLVLCTLIMSSVISTRAFLHGIIVGSTVVLLASLTLGRYAIDPFSNSSSLVGLFGSKNVVGLFAELLVLASVVVMLVSRGFVGRLLLCAGPVLLGMLCLLQSKSATSSISLLIALIVLAVMGAITRFPKGVRLPLFVLVVIWAVVLVGMGYMLDLQGDVLRFFGKSSTLTGRTYLWQAGLVDGMDAPIVGRGYAAFWIQGNIPAEHLWYKFGIASRSGFHFHNLLVQSFVDLGIIGVLLIVALLVCSLIPGLLLTLRSGMQTEAAMSVAFSTMFIVRAYAEVDILGTYSIGPMIFFSLAPRLQGGSQRRGGHNVRGYGQGA